MPLKKFKLVPIKIYENMVSGNQQLDNCKIDKSSPVDGDDTSNKRNIREIQESNINSKSNMVTSDKEFKKMLQKEEGENTPFFYRIQIHCRNLARLQIYRDRLII